MSGFHGLSQGVRSWRSHLGIVLSLSIVISGLTPSAANATSSSPFIDVADSHPFEDSIDWMFNEGITTGYPAAGGAREFRPRGSVTREAMAAFLYRYAKASETEFTPPAVSPFVDVPTTSQFYREIAWLAAENVTRGWDVGSGRSEFRPLEPIARDAMAAFLYRFSGSPAVELPVTSPFIDVSRDYPFAKQIIWLSREGISTGWDVGGGERAFKPLSPISREAMAAFLHRHSQNDVSEPDPVAEQEPDPVEEPRPDPILETIYPASGSLAGGDLVTLTGVGLDEVTVVQFGGADAVIVDRVSASEIVVRTPAGIPGEQTVVAVAPDERFSEFLAFTYVVPDPMLKSDFKPLSSTYLVDGSTVIAVDALGPDAGDAPLTEVESFVLTLAANSESPAVQQPVFLEPGTSRFAPGGFAGAVEEVLLNTDGSVSVRIVEATLDEVLETFNFEASGVPEDVVDSAVSADSFSRVNALIDSNDMASSVPAIAVSGSALECTDPSGAAAADQLVVQIGVTLENTRAYATVRSGSGGDYFRSFLYTEPVLSIAGRAESALECELKPSWVQSLKRTISLGYGLTLSIAPTAKFSINGAGEEPAPVSRTVSLC